MNRRDASPNRTVCACAVAAVGAVLTGANSLAQDSSAPAILQFFEATYNTIDDRQVDLFYSGYGAMWLPPPHRADSGGFSVGYDLFDRFDLGRPGNPTLYGTESGLKGLVRSAHNASVDVYTDLILNHNGFSDNNTFDNQGTADPSDDVTFVESGGYPGFVTSLPGDPNGDFHPDTDTGTLNGRLSGLIDIDQDKNLQFIRHPVDPSNPNNIPAGTSGIFGRPPANVPTPTNARFYPDQDLGGTVLDVDPGPGEFLITRYDFNTDDPLQGDPVLENAEQLTIRHAQWMVQEIGVDGFRIDAAKHFPESTLDLLDQAVFRASNQTNLDGSIKPVFSFSEVLDGSKPFVQSFINKQLPNSLAIDPGDFTVKGNRDALDFPLSFALRFNLTENGLANNWHNIRFASQDLEDDGINNGSAGVLFVNNHDDQNGDATAGDGAPFLDKVAHAYILMRPGNAVVYFNGEQFGSSEFRGFPTAGTDDALGGPVAGDAVSTLVGIRNSHGRGNFQERWIDDAFNPNGFSNVYIYEREASAIVGLNSRNDNGVETRSGVQTAFQPGTILVELTGNANDPVVDPVANDDIPETVKVNASGQIDVSIPGAGGHGRGYVIYGLPTPEGTLSISNVASVLQGGTPTATTNGTVRQGDIDVITSTSFDVTLNTTPVSVIDPDTGLPVRDVHADGDQALIRINQGMDLNNLPGIDNPQPGSVAEGFEEFTDVRTPGFLDDGSGSNNIGTGSGTYSQTIDATALNEGRNYITVRAYRHRNPGTGGDGGPAVYEDFKRVVYVDLLPPEVALDSQLTFDENNGGIDFNFLNADGTADSVHIFRNVGAAIDEDFILGQAQNGANPANNYGGGLFGRGYTGVETGNQSFTIVTFEPTGNFSLQRIAGVSVANGVGAGFGDINADGTISAADINSGFPNLDQIVFSENVIFDPTADTNGDGLVDTRDLLELGAVYEGAGAQPGTADAYLDLLEKRGDQDGSGTLDADDIDTLRTAIGSTEDNWLEDLDVDGVVTEDDVTLLVTGFLRTSVGDANLNGLVEQGDLNAVLNNWGDTPASNPNLGWASGDLNGNGLVEQGDLNAVLNNWGGTAAPSFALNPSVAAFVPEPAAAVVLLLGGGLLRRRPR